jgi:predicted MFS family arabinose efflux permease
MTVFRREWSLLSLICLAVFLAFLIAFEIPPIIGDLLTHFHIAYAQAGLFMTVFTVVPAVGSFLVGTYSDRYGVKNTVLLGLIVLSIAGYSSALCSSFLPMVLCRVFVGIGATLVFVPSLGTAVYVLPPRQANLGAGFFFGSLNLGLSTALLSTAVFAAAFGWPFPLKVYALAALGVAGLYLFVPGRIFAVISEESGSRRANRAQGPLRFSTPLILVLGGNFLLFFQSFGMITWLPEYLRVRHGYSPTTVGLVSMLLGLVLIPGSIVSGWLADHTNAWVVAVAGAALGAACPFALVSFPHFTVTEISAIVFLTSIGTSLLSIPLTSILSHLMPSRQRGKAAGLLITSGYSGAIFSTFFGGYLLTATRSYVVVFDIYASSMAVAAFLLLFLRSTYSDIRLAHRSDLERE